MTTVRLTFGANSTKWTILPFKIQQVHELNPLVQIFFGKWALVHCVQRWSSFLAQWVGKKVELQKHWKIYQYIQKKSQFGSINHHHHWIELLQRFCKLKGNRELRVLPWDDIHLYSECKGFSCMFVVLTDGSICRVVHWTYWEVSSVKNLFQVRVQIVRFNTFRLR